MNEATATDPRLGGEDDATTSAAQVDDHDTGADRSRDVAAEPSGDPGRPTEEEITTIIEPPRGWMPLNFREIWQYRELLLFFTKRDLKSKTKQTVGGYFWVIFPPLLQSGILTVLLGVIAGLSTDDDSTPYFIFVFAGMAIWRLFVASFSASSNCLMGQAGILTKIYIPRLLIPIASTITGVVHFAFLFGVLAILMAIFKIVPTWKILLLPVWIGLAMMTGLAFGIWFASLSVRYRDVRMAGNMIIPFWMWTVPVAYSATELFGKLDGKIDSRFIPPLETIYKLNPMYPIVQGFRWSVLSPDKMTFDPFWLVPLVLTALLLVMGMFFFRRVEATFADIV